MNTGQTALVIDPDEARARQLAAVCEQAGLQPEIAADGELGLAAIDRLSGAPFLLTQLALPRVDGFDVIARFRRRFPAGSGGHVVALSAFADLRAAAWAQRSALGLDIILTSRFSPDVLAHALKQLATVEEGANLSMPAAPEAAGGDGGEAEATRREIVHRHGLDRLPLRPPDEELQHFMQAVAERCRSPIALMTLALDERLVFPARHGIDATEIDRYTSLCNKVIEAAEPLFVPDARMNPAFHDNGLVRDGVICGYASAPVRLGDGPPIGTLCLIDSEQPLRLDLGRVRALREAATQLAELLAVKT